MYHPSSGPALPPWGKGGMFLLCPGRFPTHKSRGLKEGAPGPKICHAECTRPCEWMQCWIDGVGILALRVEYAVPWPPLIFSSTSF